MFPVGKNKIAHRVSSKDRKTVLASEAGHRLPEEKQMWKKLDEGSEQWKHRDSPYPTPAFDEHLSQVCGDTPSTHGSAASSMWSWRKRLLPYTAVPAWHSRNGELETSWKQKWKEKKTKAKLCGVQQHEV